MPDPRWAPKCSLFDGKIYDCWWRKIGGTNREARVPPRRLFRERTISVCLSSNGRGSLETRRKRIRLALREKIDSDTTSHFLFQLVSWSCDGSFTLPGKNLPFVVRVSVRGHSPGGFLSINSRYPRFFHRLRKERDLWRKRDKFQASTIENNE